MLTKENILAVLWPDRAADPALAALAATILDSTVDEGIYLADGDTHTCHAAAPVGYALLKPSLVTQPLASHSERIHVRLAFEETWDGP